MKYLNALLVLAIVFTLIVRVPAVIGLGFLDAKASSAVVNLSFTETDTLYVPAGFSVVSLQAVGDTIGVRLIGGPHYGLPDSVPVPTGKFFNVDLSTRPGGMLSYGIAVYIIGEGGSAVGVAW